MSGKLTNQMQRPCPMKAMDPSVHNMDRDNNNDIRVEDLSLAMAGAVEAVIRSQEADLTKRNSEILRALLPHLDIAARSSFAFAFLAIGVGQDSCRVFQLILLY